MFGAANPHFSGPSEFHPLYSDIAGGIPTTDLGGTECALASIAANGWAYCIRSPCSLSHRLRSTQ